MRTSTALWVVSMAISTMAQAAPAHQEEKRALPRYYFPRHIKRQIVTNGTTPNVVASTSSVAADPLSSVVAGLGLGAATSSSLASVAPVSVPVTRPDAIPGPATSSAAAVPTSSDPLGVLSSVAVVVPSSSAAPTGSAPAVVIPASSSAALDPLAGASSGSAPAVVIPASSTPTPEPASSSAAAGLIPAVSSLLAPSSAAAATPTPALVASSGAVPTSVVPAASAAPALVSSVDPNAGVSASQTGLLVGLSTILSNTDPLSILPTPTPTDTAVATPVSSGISGAGTGTGVASVTDTAAPVLSSAVSALPTDAPVLSSVVSGISGAGTGTAPTATDTNLPLTSPSDASLISTPTNTATDVSSGVASGILPSGSAVPSGSVVTPTDTATTPISAVSTDTATTPLSAASTTPTVIAATQGGTNATEATIKASSAPESPTATLAIMTTSAPPQNTLASLVPTGSDTATAVTQPSQILVQPSASDTKSTAAAPTGIPTSMPKVITPPGGNTVKPVNTTLCQIGFTHELNYGFVSSNPSSAGQIFQFLPIGTAYGLTIDQTSVKMYNIQPYDTSKSLGYITTLALLYIPTDQVNQLGVDLHTPNSPLYRHPDLTVRTLMSFINPAIPLIAGQPMDGTSSVANGASGGSVNGATATPGTPGGANPFGSDASNSAPAKASAAGIASGIVGGVVLASAAMALLSHRYRKKRRSHSRASSTSNPAWMSGADGDRNSRGSNASSQGRSIQTAQISAPVRTENSLGWN